MLEGVAESVEQLQHTVRQRGLSQKNVSRKETDQIVDRVETSTVQQ